MKNRLFDIYNDEKKKHCICCEDNTKKIEENLFDEIIAKENNQLMKKEVDSYDTRAKGSAQNIDCKRAYP